VSNSWDDGAFIVVAVLDVLDRICLPIISLPVCMKDNDDDDDENDAEVVLRVVCVPIVLIKVALTTREE